MTTMQEQYDIIHAALEEATDNGFFDRMVYEMHVKINLVLVRLGDKGVELRESVAGLNVFQAVDELMSDEDFCNIWDDHDKSIYAEYCKYPMDVALGYEKYLYSTQGLVDFLNETVEGVLKSTRNLQDNEDIKKVFEIAKEWGMDNGNVQAAVANNAASPQGKILTGVFQPA